MKIYTRTGDQGTTALFGGRRVTKNHPRIRAYGTVDEVNAMLGQARSLVTDFSDASRLDSLIHRLQEDLFVLGADLAAPSDVRVQVPRIVEDDVARLESAIDSFEADIPSLRTFVLPGGTPLASCLHVARTVCRRAERLTVEAAEAEGLNPLATVYLNRLSDLLFVLARWANHQEGVGDVPWHPSSARP